MAYTLDAQGPATCYTYMEYEVVSVSGRRRDSETRVIGSRKDGRPAMQAGGDTQDCLVGNRHLEGGNVDLLGA